ncbi:hypothetical protein NDU88_007660 [Pleurodeles waltl]|uniref:Uncharacterized protein n=1 Tax=Pleurodeles waltl TaxID=8319 RepID=A0AAV7NTS3_PLEWA|nr:hypothetical protein NDU88_007660 [Pleurodeles waltl]
MANKELTEALMFRVVTRVRTVWLNPAEAHPPSPLRRGGLWPQLPRTAWDRLGPGRACPPADGGLGGALGELQKAQMLLLDKTPLEHRSHRRSQVSALASPTPPDSPAAAPQHPQASGKQPPSTPPRTPAKAARARVQLAGVRRRGPLSLDPHRAGGGQAGHQGPVTKVQSSKALIHPIPPAPSGPPSTASTFGSGRRGWGSDTGLQKTPERRLLPAAPRSPLQLLQHLPQPQPCAAQTGQVPDHAC